MRLVSCEGNESTSPGKQPFARETSTRLRAAGASEDQERWTSELGHGESGNEPDEIAVSGGEVNELGETKRLPGGEAMP